MDGGQRDLHVKFKNLEGVEKEYVYVALKRKEAVRVAHTTLQSLFGAIAGMGSDGGAAIASAVKALDFDVFWSLAEKVLKCVIVDGVEISDINNSDYFAEHIDELYLAVYHGIEANWPKVFFQLREALTASVVAAGLEMGSLPGSPNAL